MEDLFSHLGSRINTAFCKALCSASTKGHTTFVKSRTAIIVVFILVILFLVIWASFHIEFARAHTDGDWLEVNEVFGGEATKIGPDWFVENKHKYVNVFKLFELLILDSLSIGISRELDPPSDFRELGVGAKLLENTPTMDFFMKSVSVPCRIFFIKAPRDYRIETGKLKYFSKFNDKILEATHIMYCFGNNFGDGIIFKKEMPKSLNKYYVPEKNSIICFTKQDTYGGTVWPAHKNDSRNLIFDSLRYLMVILIFGNS
jgi:hypothetical protein